MTWTLLTNHGNALLYVASNPDARIRDIAATLGITERSAQAIVSDLVEAGFLRRRREGRRNHYSVNPDAPLRHPVWEGRPVGDLLGDLRHPRRAA